MGFLKWLQTVGQYTHWPTMPDDKDAPDANLSFEDRMIKRVMSDFLNAQEFLTGVHNEMYEIHRAYHNARQYTSIRKDKKFPVPTIQSDVDQLNSDAMDKFFYSGRPATVTAMPGTSEDEVDAKQEMMDWQDRVLNIRKLISECHKDAIKYRFCCAKVDYGEMYRRKWVVELPDTTMPAIGPEGQPPQAAPGMEPEGENQQENVGSQGDVGATQLPTGADPTGVGLQDSNTGYGDVQSPIAPDEQLASWVLKDVPYFLGAIPRRVDPINVFFGPEKKEIDDEFPIMIWEEKPKRFFYSRPYFINQEKIVDGAGTAGMTNQQQNYQKRDNVGLPSAVATAEGMHEHIEWQGLVDKAELYVYLKKPQQEKAAVRTNERCWCICSVVDGTVVARLDEMPMDLDRPNIIIGIIESEEGELAGASLAGKIAPTHYAKEELMGMLLENFKQSVNRMWAINKTSWLNQQELVNKPGATYEFNAEDVRKSMMALEPGRIAPDIYNLFELFTNIGQMAGGMKPFVNGSGDANISAVGIADQVAQNAALRITEYMASFEASFIRPLYDLRNQINMNTIDEEFAYQVTGQHGWTKMDPTILRSDVDFVCESSSRLRNLNVMVQQMLQTIQVAPLALQNGQPVRIDKMLAKIMRLGFNFKEAEVEDYLPWIQLERKQGINANQLIAQNALDALKMARLQMLAAAGQMAAGGFQPQQQGNQPQGNKPDPNAGPQPNRQVPKGTSNSNVIESATVRNRTAVGDMNP